MVIQTVELEEQAATVARHLLQAVLCGALERRVIHRVQMPQMVALELFMVAVEVARQEVWDQAEHLAALGRKVL